MVTPVGSRWSGTDHVDREIGAEAHDRRREWALAMMQRAHGPIVAYGSPEWLALPDGPEKVAAVVRAAECWVLDGELTRDRLYAEQKSAEDRAFVAAREAHRAAWDGRRGCFRPDPAIAAEVEQEWREWVGEAG